MSIHIEARGSVRGMSGRSLRPEENERVLGALRELLIGTTQVELAPRLGVKQSSISGVLGHRHVAGYPFAARVAELSGMTVQQLLSGKPDNDGTGPRWRFIPGWAAAVEQAKRDFPKVSPLAWERLGNLMGERPPAMDPTTLGLLASTWDQRSTDDDRRKAIADQADREMTEEDRATDDLLRRRQEARDRGEPLPPHPDDPPPRPKSRKARAANDG